MAMRRLKAFDLDEELMGKLSRVHLQTVQDVLNLSSLHLMTILRLSNEEVDNLLLKISSSCLPKFENAYTLFSKEKNLLTIPFGDPSLDAILHGGLKRGTLMELTGPCGVGKTQFCIHLAAQFLLTANGTENTVCCIDTESAFKPDRVCEILQGKFSGNFDGTVLEKIYMFQPTSIDSFNQILSSLEMFCLEHSVSLLIIDSIASLARKEFGRGQMRNKVECLAKWAAQVKKMAQKLNMAVVVTNQVTKAVGELKNKASKDADDGFRVCPALGNTWTHFVTVRLILQYVDKNYRQLVIAKSPVAPFASIQFRIKSIGIEFKDGLTISNEGQDLYDFFIKVQPGIGIESTS